MSSSCLIIHHDYTMDEKKAVKDAERDFLSGMKPKSKSTVYIHVFDQLMINKARKDAKEDAPERRDLKELSQLYIDHYNSVFDSWCVHEGKMAALKDSEGIFMKRSLLGMPKSYISGYNRRFKESASRRAFKDVKEAKIRIFSDETDKEWLESYMRAYSVYIVR